MKQTLGKVFPRKIVDFDNDVEMLEMPNTINKNVQRFKSYEISKRGTSRFNLKKMSHTNNLQDDSILN